VQHQVLRNKQIFQYKAAWNSSGFLLRNQRTKIHRCGISIARSHEYDSANTNGAGKDQHQATTPDSWPTIDKESNRTQQGSQACAYDLKSKENQQNNHT
jgi:hypothetical protein